MSTEYQSGVEERLDQLIHLMKIGFRHEIQSLRQELESDSSYGMILELTQDEWIGAAELKRVTKEKTGLADRTIQRKISHLVEIGVLQARGGGKRIEYCSTGLV